MFAPLMNMCLEHVPTNPRLQKSRGGTHCPSASYDFYLSKYCIHILVFTAFSPSSSLVTLVPPIVVTTHYRPITLLITVYIWLGLFITVTSHLHSPKSHVSLLMPLALRIFMRNCACCLLFPPLFFLLLILLPRIFSVPLYPSPAALRGDLTTCACIASSMCCVA